MIPRHRSASGPAKRFAEACLAPGVEAMHVVTHAVREPEKAGLAEGGRQGKEKLVSAMKKGEGLCQICRAA